MSENNSGYEYLETLHAWKGNYNQGDIGRIRLSLERFGFVGALRVWREGRVIGGNHVFQALVQLEAEGATPPENVVIDPKNGAWTVLVSSAYHLTEQEAVAFAIADNRTAALASQDEGLLASYLVGIYKEDESLGLATGYDPEDLDFLLLGEPTAVDLDEGEQGAEGRPCQCPKCGFRWATDA